MNRIMHTNVFQCKTRTRWTLTAVEHLGFWSIPGLIDSVLLFSAKGGWEVMYLPFDGKRQTITAISYHHFSVFMRHVFSWSVIDGYNLIISSKCSSCWSSWSHLTYTNKISQSILYTFRLCSRGRIRVLALRLLHGKNNIYYHCI